jgi:hypothetical protein
MYSDCVKGCEAKFKPNDGNGMIIQSFSNKVNLQLINHCMDSVFYITDDESKMVNIITKHAKFTLQHVQEQVERGIDLYGPMITMKTTQTIQRCFS